MDMKRSFARSYAPPVSILVAFALSASSHAETMKGLEAYKPSATELVSSYLRADSISQEYSSRAFMVTLAPNWLNDGKRFWYRKDSKGGEKEFVLVESATGEKSPLFDHAKVAKGLSDAMGQSIDAKHLPFSTVDVVDDTTVFFETTNQGWNLNLKSSALSKVAQKSRRRRPEAPWVQDTSPPDTRSYNSANGEWTARIADDNVRIKPKDGEEFTVTTEGNPKAYFARVNWSPDSKRVVAVRVTPGDRKPVFLVESSPKNGGRAELHQRLYDLPGDKVDTFDLWVIDPSAKTAKPLEAETVDYGDLPQIRWRRDGHDFTYEKMDRGYGRWRIIEGDALTGQTHALVDDHPATFVDSTAQFRYDCGSEEIVWRSERDGWGHLYLTQPDGKTTQITRGPWVVREVKKVDEKSRTIIFGASGMNPGEDPYFLHYYRINFDGSGLIPLTPAKGDHSPSFDPNFTYVVDTYSQVDVPPVHELRRTSDGSLVATLETANIADLRAYGWRAPEQFTAKGRDGKTDIYGVVFRPSNFDPKKSYPIIEDIYAGPQDSFVPKSFRPNFSMQAFAELGFIVVKADGMGTRNRGKAFHDVCYKNLADAGFPDRILWMKALAKKYPYMDIDRVGVFGTSAGGQNAAGAVLWHPEFYKVAVASCGCHDNRMDKIWWNEQWMGLIGPHYDAQSNITNAAKLQGKLMLIVGELDSNVPPETTYRLADALEKSGKDFDLVVIPGANHTSGGPYGEHKRRDFFVRNLLGIDAPNWQALISAKNTR